MTEPARSCTRCGQTVALEATSVAIENAPQKSLLPRLVLCPHCTESLTNWLARKHTGRRARTPEREPLDAGRDSHRGHSRAPQSLVARYLFVAAVSGGLVLLMGLALAILIRELHGD